MRIGVNGNKFVATGDVGLLARHAAEIREAGLPAYWLAQHPAGSLDALTALAIFGRDVPDLALGVGVVPVWGKHPAALAATTLTAAQGTPGGLTVGIGLSHPAMVAEHLGSLYDPKPVAAMREYLEIMVPLVRDGERQEPLALWRLWPRDALRALAAGAAAHRRRHRDGVRELHGLGHQEDGRPRPRRPGAIGERSALRLFRARW